MKLAQQDLVKFIEFLSNQFKATFKPAGTSSTPKPPPSDDSPPPSAETSAPAASSSPNLPATSKIPDVEIKRKLFYPYAIWSKTSTPSPAIWTAGCSRV